MGEKKQYSTDTTTGASLYSTSFTSGKGLHIFSSDGSITAVGNTNQQPVACADSIYTFALVVSTSCPYCRYSATVFVWSTPLLLVCGTELSFTHINSSSIKTILR